MRNENASGRTLIGRILGAHGIKGVLRIHPLTDYPDRFFHMDKIHIEKPGKPPRELEVVDIAPHEGKGQILLTVAGVSDRDAAEMFAGYAITVAPEERVELPAGEYWIDSLIGMDVIDLESGEHLGNIEDVMSTGSCDVYAVRTPDGALKMIPAIGDVVREIDTDTGCMKVVLMEGLWD